MISGAYIGPLCLATAQAAAKAGLFSPAAAERLAGVPTVVSKEVSNFLICPERGDNPLSQALADTPREDTAMLYHLIDALVERAAKLTAINLSSVSLKSGKGLDPCRPICIVAEGSTFYRLKYLQPKIEYYLKQFLVDKKHVHYEIVNIENATLIGAAIAGLTN
jgi:hexokinase